jgi:hypothetical protein
MNLNAALYPFLREMGHAKCSSFAQAGRGMATEPRNSKREPSHGCRKILVTLISPLERYPILCFGVRSFVCGDSDPASAIVHIRPALRVPEAALVWTARFGAAIALRAAFGTEAETKKNENSSRNVATRRKASIQCRGCGDCIFSLRLDAANAARQPKARRSGEACENHRVQKHKLRIQPYYTRIVGRLSHIDFTGRCPVLADVFYEWRRTGTAKQLYGFEVNDGEMFAFASFSARTITSAGSTQE